MADPRPALDALPRGQVPPWELFLRTQALAWLLPAACHQAIPEAAAARFLDRLVGQPDQLRLLRATSFMVRHLPALAVFLTDQLPDLIRALPSTSVMIRQVEEGRCPGRLDVPGTLTLHASGQRTRFVSRSRHRSFDRPENRVIRALADRTLEVLSALRTAGIIQRSAWGAPALPAEGRLRHLLSTTALRDVPSGPVPPESAQAAAARGGLFAEALRWWIALESALTTAHPEALAHLIAQGALAPLEPHRRFELAVCVRLIAALVDHLAVVAPGQWHLERGLVVEGRREIATLRRPRDGARLRIFYDQVADLPPGPRDRGVRHYLGVIGRLRPDITVWIEPPEAPALAVVIEVKHTLDREYMATGFQEALTYAREYGAVLNTWPRAILVTSAPIPGAPMVGDPTIAIDWARWVPRAVIEGLLAPVQEAD